MCRSPWFRWSMVLGVALGGFFDGILLHQILQWHHLLSAVPGVGGLRMQVALDGWFHALMNGVAVLGMVGLWRVPLPVEPAWRQRMPAGLLIGFGVWHVLDAVLSHWILGIHRIRMDSDHPMLWDLGWFVIFGLLPMLAGWTLLRGGGSDGGGSDAGGGAASRPVLPLIALSGLALGGGIWAMRPPEGQAFTTIAFMPGVTPAGVFAAVVAEEARLVWADGEMGVVVVAVDAGRRLHFFRHGALMVSGSGLPAGCIDWTRPRRS